MKISKIKVKNFRSIQDAEISVSNLNIFVGQNNSGKTNLFEALDFFFNGVGRGVDLIDLKYKKHDELTLSVEVEFKGAQDGLAKMQNEKNKATLERKIGGSDCVTLIRRSDDPKKRQMIVNGEEVTPGTGFDAAVNDFLPKFEYINTKQYYDAVAKYSKTTPMGIMLSGVLSAILENDPQYQKFQKTFHDLFDGEDSGIKAKFEQVGVDVKGYLAKQFPDTKRVRFEVLPPLFDDLLKNFTTSVDDGVETFAEDKGDGMQRALMLAIIQVYADFRKQGVDAGKSFLFFIDEAELHLHPTAQRKLKDVLAELSCSSDQVFVNTHSSVFVADDCSGQTIFKVEKLEGRTEIEMIGDQQKFGLVFELLGGTPGDLLLPQNFLIVEGASEVELLTRVIGRFYSDKPKIQILDAHGDTGQVERSINAIEKLFNPLDKTIYGDKLVVLIDSPSPEREAGVKQFKKDHKSLVKSDRLFVLPKRDVEQCYPDRSDSIYGRWLKTQGEVDNMSGKQKRNLAKHVGGNITQEEFETALGVCFCALQKCWRLSFCTDNGSGEQRSAFPQYVAGEES